MGEFGYVMAIVLVVGLGATAVLDGWLAILGKVFGIVGTDWGQVGRWLKGLVRGKWLYHNDPPGVPGASDKALGWSFHYAIGIAYAALYWPFRALGLGFYPDVLPFVVIGLVLSTLAGMMILSPAMGGGFFAAKAPDRMRRIVLALVHHAVFALGQYGLTGVVLAVF